MNNKNTNTNPNQNPELEAAVIIENNDELYNRPENVAKRENMFGMLFQEDERASSVFDKLLNS